MQTSEMTLEASWAQPRVSLIVHVLNCTNSVYWKWARIKRPDQSVSQQQDECRTMKWNGDKELGHATELIRKIVEIRTKKEKDGECRVGQREMDQLNVIYFSDTLNNNLIKCLYIRTCNIHLIYEFQNQIICYLSNWSQFGYENVQ